VSVTQDVHAAATRAKHSRLLEALARIGFIGYGLTHLLVAWLAVRIALGQPAQAGDQSGALRTLVDEPGGRLLVWAICVGFAAMAIWQALEAAVGHRSDTGARRTAERLASAGRVLFYGYLGYTAWKVASGSPKTSADTQQSTSAGLMATETGRWTVSAIGIGVLCLGVGLIWYGLTRQFERHLRTGEMTDEIRRTARWLGIVGYTAKGTAYGIAGLLLFLAARTYDPSKARGLDAALRTLAGQPYGQTLLLVAAAGIGSFAAFCLLQARYRKV
jgi:hypothetical protein